MRSYRPWRLSAAAAALAVLVSMPALAQGPPRDGQNAGPGGFRLPPPPLLSTLDANSDGEITADEIENAVAALKKLDKNSDGELASDEMMPFGRGFGGPGGGAMMHRRTAVFAKFDHNHDGVLKGEERAEARKYIQENLPMREGPGGGPPGGGPGFGGPGFGGPGFGGPGGGPGGGMDFGGPPGFGGPPDDMGFGPPGFGGPPDDMAMGGPGFGPPGADGDVGRGPAADDARGGDAGAPDADRGMRGRRGRGGFGGPGGGPFGGRNRQPATPGKQLTPADVQSYPDRDLYDPDVVRTIFLQFENEDWEVELEEFRMTDVDVPAQMIVDGKTYKDVGVRFRGNTSYQMVPRGSKRSFNITVDYGQKKQRLYGRKTLNLLNANSDPSLLREVLFNRIAREYLPALNANLVRVVINGENWGIYTNEEQFNKDFLRQWFGDANGPRWKVPPNFSGASGLSYLGEDVAQYKRNYLIKSKDNDADWKKVIDVCRVLKETPTDQREATFDKYMNVDEMLWFLAVDNVLVDGDGYFSRASDYTIYLDSRYNRLYTFAHDNNETLREPEGPGMGGPGGPGGPGGFGGPGGPGGRGGEGDQQDPLSQVGSENRALITSLLTVPHWKARYLAHVRTIAEVSLDGNAFGAMFERYRALIDQDVKEDTKKLVSYDEFAKSDVASSGGGGGPFGGAPALKPFIMARREYLLNHPEISKPYPHIEAVTHRPLHASADQPTPDDQVIVEAKLVGDPKPQTVLLYYAFSQGAPFDQIAMLDDGQHHDKQAGDGTYTAALPHAAGQHQALYYVEARADESIGTTAFLPAEAEMKPLRCELAATTESETPVVINEVMAVNKHSVKNPQGKYCDWVELYNRSDRPVDVSRMYLSDSTSNLRKWSFPAETEIPAHGTVVVWLDDDARASGGGLHASFKLSKSGETIYLSDTDALDNAIRDKVAFEKLKENVSYGRFPDGSTRWQPMVPTPDSPNRTNQ